MTSRFRLIVPAGVVAVAGIALALVVLRGERSDAVLASGTVEVTEADLGFQVPGRIDSIAVREGDTVRVGEELAWLDRAGALARRQAVEAQRAAAEARLTELERGFRSEEIAQARESLRAATERLADATREVERARRLFEGGAVSRRQLEAEETAATVADAQREAAAEQLALLETGPRREQIAAQRATVAQAVAALAQADVALANAVIRAPFDGQVTLRHREPGEIVPAGAAVLTVANPGDRWVRIYVRGDQVGRLGLGQPADITADAYPERRYRGEVVFIASEAEFTPRNVQTTAERVKLVYRVKVRVVEDAAYDLKPGLPADVHIAPRGE
jgi:HlyD family secretion protein